MHAKHGASRASKADRNGPQHGLQPHEPTQLTLCFEPSLPERFASLREFVAFRVQEMKLNAKTLASDMDLSPTVLSRKLKPADGDTSRLTVDDLESYIAATNDVAPLEYLAAKFLDTPEARKVRTLSRLETLLQQIEGGIALLKDNA